MDRDSIIEAIRASRFATEMPNLEGCLEPYCQITTERCPMEQITEGASRMGGVPDLPHTFKWPEAAGRPLEFLCQLNLRDVQTACRTPLLPQQGWLVAFYDNKEQPWGFDPKEIDHWNMTYVDCDVAELKRVDLPSAIAPPNAEFEPFHPCRLNLGRKYCLPCIMDELTLDYAAGKENWDAYEAFQSSLEGVDPDSTGNHRLMGHPMLIQGDCKLECQLASNGFKCGGPEAYADPAIVSLKSGAADWQLLLQLDTDEEGPGWMWGDCGRLYFYARQQDLATRNFGNVWITLQCF